MTLSQMLSAGDASLSEAETNKLIDQNMRLQKVCTNTEKELESMKQQNLEIIHQRDFYQDQVCIINYKLYPWFNFFMLLLDHDILLSFVIFTPQVQGTLQIPKIWRRNNVVYRLRCLEMLIKINRLEFLYGITWSSVDN